MYEQFARLDTHFHLGPAAYRAMTIDCYAAYRRVAERASQQ